MGDQELHWDYRQRTVDHMVAEADRFAPFLEDDEAFDAYVPRMRKDGEWGGHLELQAISTAFGVNVVVHQLESPPWEIRNHPASAPIVSLSYHDGMHYASVRCGLGFGSHLFAAPGIWAPLRVCRVVRLCARGWVGWVT
jgi:OTU domain-containing protein 3